MKKLKRLGAIAAISLLALMVNPTSSAQAKPSDTAKLADTWDSCISGRLCLWRDSWYESDLGMYSPSYSCYSMGVMNNSASSIRNRTGVTIRLYDSGDCTGSYTTFWAYDYSGYLGATGWNDRISSFKRV